MSVPELDRVLEYLARIGNSGWVNEAELAKNLGISEAEIQPIVKQGVEEKKIRTNDNGDLQIMVRGSASGHLDGNVAKQTKSQTESISRSKGTETKKTTKKSGWLAKPFYHEESETETTRRFEEGIGKGNHSESRLTLRAVLTLATVVTLAGAVIVVWIVQHPLSAPSDPQTSVKGSKPGPNTSDTSASHAKQSPSDKRDSQPSAQASVKDDPQAGPNAPDTSASHDKRSPSDKRDSQPSAQASVKDDPQAGPNALDTSASHAKQSPSDKRDSQPPSVKIESLSPTLGRLVEIQKELPPPFLATDGEIKQVSQALKQIDDDKKLQDCNDEEALAMVSVVFQYKGIACAVNRRYEEAEEALGRGYSFSVRLAQKNPTWVPPLRLKETPVPNDLPTAAVQACLVATSYSFAIIAKANGTPSEDDKQKIRSMLDAALVSLRAIPDHGMAWKEAHSEIVFAFWGIGDYAKARQEVQRTLKAIPDKDPMAKSAVERRQLAVMYLVLGSLQAEEGSIDDSLESLKQAISFHAVFQSDGAIPSRYLLNARNDNRPLRQAKTLETALAFYRKTDRCPKCSYGLACVLAKQGAQLSGESRARTLNEAEKLLLSCIEASEKDGREVDIDAVKTDPFLASIVTRDAVRHALETFRWQPAEPDEWPPFDITADTRPCRRFHFANIVGAGRESGR